MKEKISVSSLILATLCMISGLVMLLPTLTPNVTGAFVVEQLERNHFWWVVAAGILSSMVGIATSELSPREKRRIKERIHACIKYA